MPELPAPPLYGAGRSVMSPDAAGNVTEAGSPFRNRDAAGRSLKIQVTRERFGAENFSFVPYKSIHALDNQ
jgi:hypothetical protein